MTSEPRLPSIAKLIGVSKSIAMLDAVLSPEWQYRYYSFNSKWGPGEQMASMRDGCGDEYFILFNAHGAILKGFDHESSAAEYVSDHNSPLPKMFDGVPRFFDGFLKEPAFSIDQTTFCRWRTNTDSQWQSGHPLYPNLPDPSGAGWMLRILEGDATDYTQWAKQYYEVPVDLDAVQRIYRHEPLSQSLVNILNSGITLKDLAADIDEIDYPCN